MAKEKMAVYFHPETIKKIEQATLPTTSLLSDLGILSVFILERALMTMFPE